MIVRTRSFSGIDIFESDFNDLDVASLTAAQLSEINSITAEKRRRERAMTYALVNFAATFTAADGTHPYSAITGALLRHRDNGAPYLTDHNDELPLSISISHCKSAACIALGARSLRFGIDIEEATDRLARIADKFLSAGEKTYIHGDLLLCAWTIKEAVYKAADTPGLPLRDGIDIVSITPTASITRALDATYTGTTMRTSDRCLTLCVKI